MKISDCNKTQPRLLRHHMAGVYFGYLQGPGEIPGTNRYLARHCWNWRKRLGATPLATHGPGAGSSVGPWVVIDLPVVEGLVLNVIVEDAKAIEAWEKFKVTVEQAAS